MPIREEMSEVALQFAHAHAHMLCCRAKGVRDTFRGIIKWQGPIKTGLLLPPAASYIN